MADFSRRVRRILKKHGCTFVRQGKGDHEIWHSPIVNANFAVDGKISKKGTANGTLINAGIKERV
jgi:hypothetical protein